MIKTCGSCVNNLGKRCSRGRWQAGPGVTDDALNVLKSSAADQCFYWASDFEHYSSCKGCTALDHFGWSCKLGYPVKALRKFTPGTPCPKPTTDEELSRYGS